MPRRLKRQPDPPVVQEEGFTDRQLVFIQHYVAWRKVTKAAIAAGCPADSASTQGSRWLANPRIAEEIRRQILAQAEQLNITPRRILQRYEQLAFSNIADFTYIEDGKLYCDFSDVTDRSALAVIKEADFDIEEIEEVDEETGEVTKRVKLGRAKIKLHDSTKALDKLAELLRMTQTPVQLHINQTNDNRSLNVGMLDEEQREQLRELLTLAAPGEETKDDDDNTA